MTRDFVRKEVAPFAAQWDRDATVPLDTLRRIGALGLFGVCIPEEWGGAGADFIAYTLATEELAYGDAGICNMVSASNSYGFKLRDFGTPAQKEQYLRPVASGRELGCMLLTEPQAGSDAANLRTRAERHGDRYVINGSKSLITSGRSARYAVVLAVTEVLRVEHKLGHRTNDTCQVALEDLEVPAENLLGERGRGLKVALSGLDSGRIGVAAQSIGVARAAFDAAFAYARGREAFGKRLTEHQAIAFKLAEMATEIEAARQMCRNAAALKEERARCIKEASMAKLFASQMCERVCSAAIQIHGGYGFINDYPVEKFYRDARVFQIYDGTNEVQKILIFRELEAGH